jgi:hypothetical protein
MDGAIAHWLEQHHLETVSCRDPFEACVYALTRPDACPDLILLGGDWLAAEEHVIIDYLRETWPSAAIVLYGLGFSPTEFRNRPGLRCFDSAAAVNRLTAEPPEAIVKLLRETHPAARPISAAAGLIRELPPRDRAIPDGLRSETPAAARNSPVQAHGVESPAPLKRAEPDAPDKNAPTAAHSILTQEELTALLEDDE